MEKITSSQNPLVKKLVKLSQKQSFRNRENLTIIEGLHLAEEYLNKFGRPEICVISGFAEKHFSNTEFKNIVQKCQDLKTRIVQLDQKIYSKISPVIDGAGVLFVVKIPEVADINFGANTLILDGIQDMGNLGTIFRSAAAFGFEQIICSPETASAWSPKVLRAGMGSHFRLNIFENEDLKNVISKLEIPVLATSLTAEKTIFDADISKNVAWIFGNEGRGVSPEIQKMADFSVKIPQSSSVESLNVAMATTICLFESFKNVKNTTK